MTDVAELAAFLLREPPEDRQRFSGTENPVFRTFLHTDTRSGRCGIRTCQRSAGFTVRPSVWKGKAGQSGDQVGKKGAELRGGQAAGNVGILSESDLGEHPRELCGSQTSIFPHRQG